ncbi:MAG TPA: putative sulfate exporter family transporter [Burkholderiaceae bacterium]|nr:putative sulfate exporter family transporter [Burkholderiaceae bacterium]
MSAATARARALLPGLLVCLTVAMAAGFMSQQYGGPQVLYALLIGLALHTVGSEGALAAGVEFCSRTLLRLGVALLGARITLPVIFDLGLASALVIALAVVLTIGLGWLLSNVLRLPFEQGIVSGGAVAICGVSAALALASIFPRKPETERFTLLVAAGVTLLSTVAMVIYPLLATAFHFGAVQTGLFLGGSIHDVAQVVAAAMMVSQGTADSATVVKLFRVALLVPVVLTLALAIGLRSRADPDRGARPPLLPSFLVAFCVLVALSSAGYIPNAAVDVASVSSRWLLVIAIAAVGVKSSPAELIRMGWAPAVMLLAETVFIGTLVFASAWLMGS